MLGRAGRAVNAQRFFSTHRHHIGRHIADAAWISAIGSTGYVLARNAVHATIAVASPVASSGDSETTSTLGMGKRK